jgi:hypothetical protein
MGLSGMGGYYLVNLNSRVYLSVGYKEFFKK